MRGDEQQAPSLAAELESAAVQALHNLVRRPLDSVGSLIELLTAGVLPALRAGDGDDAHSQLYLRLSEAAEALTIIALRPSLARGATRDLRVVRHQIQTIGQLAAQLGQWEPVAASQEAEEAARQRLYFVAPPDRPPTEAHVLRHRPRPLKVWSPQRQLPVHPVPAEVASRVEPFFELSGLVERPLRLGSLELAALDRHEIVDDFRCEEGWSVPELRWRGILLADVLVLASPSARARHVRVGAGAYTHSFPMSVAQHALLCESLGGKPLGPEHGGPWRLLVPGAECFTSVKWVDRIELREDPGNPSAEETARSRLSYIRT